MPEYTALDEFFDPDLVLPMRGKKYRITSPSASDGLRLRKLMLTTDRQLTDTEELTEVMALLGATEDESGAWSGGLWGEMEADGLTWPEILHAGRTALMHYGLSTTLAQVNWSMGGVVDSGSGNLMPPEPKTAPGARSSSPKKRAAAKKAAPRKSTSRSPARTAKTTPAAGR